MGNDFFAELLDNLRVSRQSKQRVAHQDGCCLVGRDPDTSQLGSKFQLLWHMTGDSPEKVASKLPFRISSRLPSILLFPKLLISLVDVAVQEAMDTFTSREPFLITVQKQKRAQLETKT